MVYHQEYPQQIWGRDQCVIDSFWHQPLLMMPFIPFKGKFGMMISRHRNGEFFARAVKLFGINGTVKNRPLSSQKTGIPSTLTFPFEVSYDNFEIAES
jgi:lysophospholipid acyltransferase (LPLAT)-like uncharacterized protein